MAHSRPMSGLGVSPGLIGAREGDKGGWRGAEAIESGNEKPPACDRRRVEVEADRGRG